MTLAGTDVGTGSSILFASGFFAELQDITWDGIERGFHETTHMGTTVARTFEPNRLYDPGGLTVEMHLEPTVDFTSVLVAVAEAITLEFPGADTWAANGFLTGLQMQDPLEDKIVVTATIKFSGEITVTDVV